MTAKEQLYEKLSAEHAEFIDDLKNAPPDKILDSAYEKVFKDDILSCFEYGDSFSEKQIAALLALDYPLDALYRNWLDTDVSYMDDLSDTIYSFATREAQEQSGIDGEEIAEAVEMDDSEMQTAEVINGELSIGDWVIAAPSDEYGYLLGVVTAIDKLGTPEHDTENTGDDIHVDFYAFDYPPERIAEIEEQFSDLYGEPKTFDELPLDDVIMAPDTLIRITELGHDEITRMGNLLQNCVAFCNCFPGAVEPQSDLHAELMERLDKNLADYHNSLMGFGKRELIDMAGKIAAMKDVHDYMTTTRGFDDEEIQFYLQFQSPLEVVADAWLQRNADNEDLSFTLDFVFDKKDALVDYPLISAVEATSETPPVEPVSRETIQAYNMGAPEFEKLMYGLLPDASLTAMMNWKGYASDLEANGTHTKAEFFLEMFIEFDLVKQHYGEKIAMKLFDYAEHFTLNPFEVRGAANHLRDGKHISEIENLSVEGMCDRLPEEWDESERAIRAFISNEGKYIRPEKAEIISEDVSEAEHEYIVQAVRATDYGMEADEFETRMATLFPDGSPKAMESWIGYADFTESELGHSKERTLLEYCVEFGLIKQHYGDEIALQLFNLAESSNPNVFELRPAAKLLKDGADISEVHDLVLENDLCMTISEDAEFGKAIIAFVEQNTTNPVSEKVTDDAVHDAKPSPERPPADKKRSIGDRIAAGNEKVKAYKEQKAQTPENTTKHKKEDIIE